MLHPKLKMLSMKEYNGQRFSFSLSLSLYLVYLPTYNSKSNPNNNKRLCSLLQNFSLSPSRFLALALSKVLVSCNSSLSIFSSSSPSLLLLLARTTREQTRRDLKVTTMINATPLLPLVVALLNHYLQTRLAERH